MTSSIHNRFKTLAICQVLLIVPIISFAQFFQNSGLQQNIQVNPAEGYNGNGMSFYDFDKDGWDDLSFAVLNDSLKFYRNVEGNFEPFSLAIGNLGDAKHLVWVDFDNDADADLMVCSSLSQTRLFENVGNLELVDITETCGLDVSNEHETYGCSWADYDRDGYLDFYLNNYPSGSIEDPAENFLYRNNGDGTFSDVTSTAGVGNGIQQSFQSIWFDYDNDSWPDLYVINDRLFMPNALYKNNGDGTFDDVSEESGTDLLLYAMSATSGDYDNDGDLDLYVSNSQAGNVFLQNNGNGTFSDITALTQTHVYELCWSANWLDIDNDMFQDLYVSTWQVGYETGQNFIYRNTGINPMTNENNIAFPGDDLQGYTNVSGDVNNDGYTDLAMYNDHVDHASLWMNNASAGNNYIKISLEGQISNRDGISSWIKVHTGPTSQSRYTYCGEDYLAQDSQHEIIGLGTHETIDSLKVSWLSGHEDIYYNVEANQTLNILEGSSLQNEIVYSGQDSICPGDSILLQAGVFSSYLWSTGDTTSSIYASTEGSYSVNVQMDLGLTIQSNIIELNIFPEPINEISTSGIVCFGDSSASAWASNIAETGVQSILWDSALMGDTLYSIPSGIHSCLLTDLNGCTNYSEFEILETDEIIVEFETNDVLCYGDSTGSATAIISGGAGNVLVDWDGINNDYLSAGEYSVQLIDSMLCSITGQFEINQADSISLSLDLNDANESDQGSASIDISGGTPPYEILWSTNEDTEDIENLQQGDYTVSVTDFNDCQHSMEFSIVNLGLENLESNDFVIYPNPNQGIINISTEYQLDGLIISLLDSKGELVFHEKAKSMLDISHVASGNYVLTILKDGKIIYKNSMFKK